MADFEGRDGNSLLNKSQAVLGGESHCATVRFASGAPSASGAGFGLLVGSCFATERCAAGAPSASGAGFALLVRPSVFWWGVASQRSAALLVRLRLLVRE